MSETTAWAISALIGIVTACTCGLIFGWHKGYDEGYTGGKTVGKVEGYIEGRRDMKWLNDRKKQLNIE